MKIHPIKHQAEENEEDFMSQILQEMEQTESTPSNPSKPSKITTQDCVKAILNHPSYKNTNPRDWKRQSKSKDTAGNWIRVFLNKTLGITLGVVENPAAMGGLTITYLGKNSETLQPAAPQSTPQIDTQGSQYSLVYYHITPITEENNEAITGGLGTPGTYILSVTSKSYWNQHHCQIDHIDSDLQTALDSLPFTMDEEMESVYYVTQEQLDVIQANPLFFQHPAFVAFMEAHPMQA